MLFHAVGGDSKKSCYFSILKSARNVIQDLDLPGAELRRGSVGFRRSTDVVVDYAFTYGSGADGREKPVLRAVL